MQIIIMNLFEALKDPNIKTRLHELNSTHEGTIESSWFSVVLSRPAKQKEVVVFMASENNQILGCAYVNAIMNTISKDHKLGIYVDPKFRRQGIGTKLFVRVKEIYKKLYVTALSTDPIPGRTFYKKLGEQPN